MWITFTLGKQPKDKDCDIMANAPEIIAWLAMMEAATATTNIGQYKGSAHAFHFLKTTVTFQSGINNHSVIT